MPITKAKGKEESAHSPIKAKAKKEIWHTARKRASKDATQRLKEKMKRGTQPGKMKCSSNWKQLGLHVLIDPHGVSARREAPRMAAWLVSYQLWI